jgi:transketolase
VRDSFAEQLYQEAIKNKNIYIVVADISPAGSMLKFRERFPNRFINVGVSEQAMIGIAAGLAIKGKKVFTYTIATFSLYRPFEMIRDNFCYQNLPVTVVGMGAGTIYNNLGGTHMSQEDISICRSVPNFNIISPSDPMEMRSAVSYCVKNKRRNTIYLRIGKSGEKIFTKYALEKWKFGKIRKIQKGYNVCIISHGILIKISFEISDALKKEKIIPEIYTAHTLKPFDSKGFQKICEKFNIIISIEDHSEIGGLGSILKEEAFNNKFQGTLLIFSLKDKFINDYGSQESLLDKHGISLKKILKKLKNNLAK